MASNVLIVSFRPFSFPFPWSSLVDVILSIAGVAILFELSFDGFVVPVVASSFFPDSIPTVLVSAILRTADVAHTRTLLSMLLDTFPSVMFEASSSSIFARARTRINQVLSQVAQFN